MTSSPRAQPLCIACAADEAYAMPLTVTLTSALSHLPAGSDPINIYVLSNGITRPSQSRIETCLRAKRAGRQITFIECNLASFQGMPTTAHITVSMYLRLLLAELLPKEIDRIIYVDSDVLIEKNLYDLWAEDVSDYALAAVVEFANPTVREALQGFWQDAGLDPDTPAFCSGMLLINLDDWRRTDLKSRCVQFVRTYADRLQCPDQDALNAVVDGRWKQLDPRWDTQFGTVQNNAIHPKAMAAFTALGITPQMLMFESWITHFVGSNKPWIAGLNNPLRQRYHRYLKQSGWFSAPGYIAWQMKWFTGAASRVIRSKLR